MNPTADFMRAKSKQLKTKPQDAPVVAEELEDYANVIDPIAADPNNFITLSYASDIEHRLEGMRRFKKGELFDGATMIVNGNVLNGNAGGIVDRYDDGSIRHARFAGLVPVAATGTQVQFTDRAILGEPPTAEEMLADYDFECMIKFIRVDDDDPDFDPQVVSASARDLISQGKYELLFSGPDAFSVWIGGPKLTRAAPLGFTEHKSVDPGFRVTFWRAARDYCLHNWQLWNGNSLYHGDVAVDSIEVWMGHSNPRLIYSDTPSSKCASYAASVVMRGPYWSGVVPPKVKIDWNIEHMASTGAVRNYAPFKAKALWVDPISNKTYLQKIKSKWSTATKSALWAKGLWYSYGMGSFVPDQEAEPFVCLLAYVTDDPDIQNIAIQHAQLAGNWRMVFYGGDETKHFDKDDQVPSVGRPHSQFAYPTARLDYNTGGIAKKIDPYPHTASKYGFDSGHLPQPWLYAYNITGGPEFLFCMQAWCAFVHAHEDVNSTMTRPSGFDNWRVGNAGDGDIVAAVGEQERSKGAASRFDGVTVDMTPNGTPEKAHFLRLAHDQAAVMAGQKGIAVPPEYASSKAYLYGQLCQQTAGGAVYENHPMQWAARAQAGKNAEDHADDFIHGDTGCHSPWQNNYIVDGISEVWARIPELRPLIEPLLDWLDKPWVDLAERAAVGELDIRLARIYRTPHRAGGLGLWFVSWEETRDEFVPSALASTYSSTGSDYPFYFAAGMARARERGRLSEAGWLKASSFYASNSEYDDCGSYYVAPRV